MTAPVPSFCDSPDTTHKPEILLDSGAYSVWNAARKGKTDAISVDGYCNFILEYADYIGSYINLDYIYPASAEEAAERSFANYTHMRSRGLRPIPVFHAGEDIKWLYRMLDDGADYICLSSTGMGLGVAEERNWYSACWSALVNQDGDPIVKVHALGETRPINLETFPWYSVDSSSWGQQAGRGKLLVRGNDGKRMTVAARKDGKHHSNEPDITQLGEAGTAWLRGQLALHSIDLDHLEGRALSDLSRRLHLAMVDYLRMGQEFKRPRFLANGLLNFRREDDRKRPGISFDSPKIFLTSYLAQAFVDCVQRVRYPYILLSYAFLRDPRSAATRNGLKMMGVPTV